MCVVSPRCAWDHLVHAGAKPRTERQPACRGGLALSAHSSTSRQHPQTQDLTGQGKRKGETTARGRGAGGFLWKARQTTPGYCWSSPKCRKLCLAYAVVAGPRI